MKTLNIGDIVKINKESLEGDFSLSIYDEELIIVSFESGLFTKYKVRGVSSGIENYLYGDELIAVDVHDKN